MHAYKNSLSPHTHTHANTYTKENVSVVVIWKIIIIAIKLAEMRNELVVKMNEKWKPG